MDDDLKAVKDRLEKAQATVISLMNDAWDLGNIHDSTRLGGKLEGISLALEYIRQEELVDAFAGAADHEKPWLVRHLESRSV